MPRIRRLDKLPRRKVTIDELIGLSDVGEVVDNILEDKSEIKELYAIWTIEGEIRQSWCGLTPARRLWLLERVKHNLMQGANDPEQD